MAGRPKKNTIDYFPHFVSSNRKIFSIERRFGLKGYAGYYKLLELLGKSENHYYEFKGTENKDYALVETGCKEEDFLDLMKLLMALDLLDSELWEEKRIIWIPSFIETLQPVYDKRQNELPGKPFTDKLMKNSEAESNQNLKQDIKKSISDPEIPISDPEIPISVTETPISGTEIHKVKESKGKESVVNGKQETNTHHFNIPPWAIDIGKQYPEVDIALSYKKYELNRKSNRKSIDKDSFEYWVLNDHEKGWNLKKPEKSINTTLYCTHCNFAKDVPSSKTWGHLCPECKGTLVHKNELPYFKKQKEKVKT